ncbi:hypothetical protein GX586_09600, partial [bacterium]|nr:hypothetical protein [bacterium]
IAPPDRLHVARLDVSNAVLSIGPGAAIGMSDYTPGSMHFWPGAGFRFCGAPGDAVVVSNFLGLNPWPGLNLHAQSTGLITWTRITRALGHSLSNAALAISNSVIETLQDGFTVSDGSALDAYRTDFSGFVNRGMEFTGQSRSVLRQCSFHGNNVPYINTVSADGSSLVDARYCWWNSPDGPYPYGAYTNERVTSNVLVFPWLLAAPGVQTNEPFIAITSHAAEPVVTADPQILLWGVCTDDARVARVVFRNIGSTVSGAASLLTPSNWAAQVWLFPGTNQIGLSAYDDKGNGSVAGIMVICTGGGSYMGAAQPPVFAPIPQRVVARFRPLQFDVIAAAPEPAVLTYWAEGLPQGAMFNPVARRFTWTPLAAGIFTNIRFFATDGMLVGSVGAAVIVSNITSGALPPITILTETLPTAYRYEPYYFALAVENAAGPVTWSFAGPTPPEGLEASRAGIIAGVSTYSGDASSTFTVTARDARGAASGATKTLVLDTSRGAPPGSLRVATMELPVTVSGTAVSVALAATNGAQPYAWLDGSGILAGHGLTVSNDGMLAGAAHADVEVPWTALVGDASNVSSFASLVLPVVTPGRQLQLVPMGNLLKLRVAHLTAKSLLKLRLRFATPAGFTIAGDMVATGRAGLTLVDGKMEKTAIPGRKLLYLRKEGSTVNKVLVTQRAKDVQAIFLLKNVGLAHAFEPYGVRNATEEITAALPVWARIGDFSMLVEDVAVPMKSKLGKTSVGTVKW